MEESTTYQAILEEGLTQGLSQGLRAALQRLGTKKFGVPNGAILAELQLISDATRLERLTEGVLDTENWEDLLAIR